MIKSVLVPLDGSFISELAISPALRIVQQTGGTLYLMRIPVDYVGDSQPDPGYDRVWTAENSLPVNEDTAEYLREVKTRLVRPGISVRTLVANGDRGQSIAATASVKNVDLIVMGTHARSGLSRWLLGSVSCDLLRIASAPMLFMRQRREINHVMVTLDGSRLAEQIVDTASEIAQMFNCQITLVQIGNGANAAGSEPYLENVAGPLREKGLEINTAALDGPVSNEILSYAKRYEVDLVAMSTRGRVGLKRLVFGQRYRRRVLWFTMRNVDRSPIRKRARVDQAKAYE